MKKINLVGPVDKRAIAYPLIKTLMFLGKVLIVTDDSNFRRFSETKELCFDFAQSEFMTVLDIDSSVLGEVNSRSGGFEYILFISTDNFVEGCDRTLYCHGVDKSFASKYTITEIEKSEFTEVFITFSKLEDPKALKIEPSKSVMGYIFDCEEKQEFLGTKDPAYATMLHKFFEKELDIPKATIKGLLLRKE